jgi:hypothetical protein
VFNRPHRRVGDLLHGRFEAVLAEPETYNEHCTRLVFSKTWPVCLKPYSIIIGWFHAMLTLRWLKREHSFIVLFHLVSRGTKA